MGPWVKRWDGSLVPKYDVAVDVGVQVRYTIGLGDVLECSFPLARWVITASPNCVIGAITVDVHIG